MIPVVISLNSLLAHHMDIVNTCNKLIQTNLRYMEVEGVSTKHKSECTEQIMELRKEKAEAKAAIKRLNTIINN